MLGNAAAAVAPSPDLTPPSRCSLVLCSLLQINSLKELSGLSLHDFSFALLNPLQRGFCLNVPPKQWASDLRVPEPAVTPSPSFHSASWKDLTHLLLLLVRSSWFSSCLTDCSPSTSSAGFSSPFALKHWPVPALILGPLSTLVPRLVSTRLMASSTNYTR